MNIALTRVLLAVSMISIIAVSAAVYLDLINKQQKTSYTDLGDILAKNMDEALLKGSSKTVNLKLKNVKISSFTINAKLKIYFRDLGISNEELKQFLEKYNTAYQADLTVQGVKIRTGSPPPYFMPSNPLLLVNSTSENPNNRVIIVYSDGKNYYVVPRVIITVEKNPKPGNNNYTIFITVPKLRVICSGGCNSLNGFYDLFISTEKHKLTPIPYEVSVPWVNGHSLKAELEGSSNQVPKELYGETDLVTINDYSKLHIIVETANFTLVFQQTG